MMSVEAYLNCIDDFPDGIIVVDEMDKILLTNGNVESMFGLEKLELLGKHTDFLFSSFKIESSNMKIENREYLLMMKNNTELCVDIRVNELKKAKGTIKIISIRDISSYKQFSNEVLKTNERFRGLLNNLDTGIVVHNADSSVMKCNPKAEELLDLSEAQMLGKLAIDPNWKFVDENYVSLEVENYPVAQIQMTQKNLESIVLGVYRPVRKDLVWLLVNGYPVFNSNGELSEMVINFNDITERKLLQKQIEQEISIKDVFFNSSKDIFWSLDCDLNLVTTNETFNINSLSLYGKSLVVNEPLLQEDLYGKPVIDYWLNFYHKVLKGETVFTEYEMPKGKFNDVEWYELKMTPIYQGVDLIGIACFGRNITYRVRAEKKIKASLKEKEILLAEIHHRIKNNLTLIWSLLQLQEINSDNEEVKNALSVSRKRIKSTASIHEMLYKSESLHDIKIKDYLLELFDYLKINNQIELEYIGDEISVDMDHAMPIGLLMNELLMNSFKHSYTEKSKGKIKVKTSLEGDLLTIFVEDFEGNFPQNIEFKSSKSTGLVLAHTFVEQLNGSLDLIQNSPPIYKIQILIHDNN